MDALMQSIVDRGTQPQRYKMSHAQIVRAPDGKQVRLINADRKPTPSGVAYYRKLGVPPPQLYDYQQGLINDTHVRGFDGKEIKVRSRNADGSWKILKAGEAYFRYNRVEHLAQVPYLVIIYEGTNGGWPATRAGTYRCRRTSPTPPLRS